MVASASQGLAHHMGTLTATRPHTFFLAAHGTLADIPCGTPPASIPSHSPPAPARCLRPLKLFGEDALLDWPGAFPALIPERDAFMAKALAAVATGGCGVPLSMQHAHPPRARPAATPDPTAPTGTGGPVRHTNSWPFQLAPNVT